MLERTSGLSAVETVRPGRRSAGAWWGFAGILLLGFAVRLYGVAGKPFWMDEVTTIRRASLPLGRLVTDSVFFHQLPAYFVVTSWMLPWGHDELAMRLPAAVFGALGCALAFGVARSLAGSAAGVAAGLLMALAPEQVQYGQEARSYSMVMCGILIGFWGLVLLARAPALASLNWRDMAAPRAAWAAYVLGTVAALNVLSVALFWFVAANVAAPVLAVRSFRPRGFWRNWLAAQAVILALSAPWYVAMKLLGQRGAMGGLDWVPPLTWLRVWWTIDGTYLMHPTSLITVRIFSGGVPGCGWLVLAMAIAGAAALWRRPAQLAVVGAGILVLPLLLLAISTVSPIWMPRYVIWSAAPFFVCAGLAVSRLPPRAQWPAVGLLAVLLAVNLAPYYHDETKPLWNLAGQDLHAGLQPGDLILTDDPQAIAMMNLYLARQNTPISAKSWTLDIGKAKAALAAGHHVWTVQGRVGQADHETQAQFLARIAALGTPALREPAGLDIIVERFDPPKK
jgi:4-amino-4-deoxy-L-arabinose transferase-like glycosyltransferase